MTLAGGARPLRIGVCAPYDLALDGGVNTHIRAQARALRSLGHHVAVFGASSRPLTGGELALSHCISFVIGGTETGVGMDPRSWSRVARLLRSAQFDVLHVHEPLMPLVPWCAVLQATAPVVATFHTHREEGHRWYRRYRALLTPLMRRIRTRLAVSEAARRTVAEAFPGPYEVVPNGIDVSRFDRPAARPGVMPDHRRSVLFVGRLEPRKGVDCLVRAMRIVQERAPDAQLVLVGDGPDRPALEDAGRLAGVDVIFAGRVSDETLPAFYRAADIVCAPARRGESFGIVLLEAMAAERPIVATRIEGYAELLASAQSARLADVDNPRSLAGEITALLEEPALGRTLGARGRLFAADYDWKTIARRLEAIYLDAVTGREMSGQNEYGSCGLNASDASERFERPLTR